MREEKTTTVTRSNHTSGYPGVAKQRNGRHPFLIEVRGMYPEYFSEIKDDIAVRMDAEKRLNEAPCTFITERGQKKELRV